MAKPVEDTEKGSLMQMMINKVISAGVFVYKMSASIHGATSIAFCCRGVNDVLSTKNLRDPDNGCTVAQLGIEFDINLVVSIILDSLIGNGVAADCATQETVPLEHVRLDCFEQIVLVDEGSERVRERRAWIILAQSPNKSKARQEPVPTRRRDHRARQRSIWHCHLSCTPPIYLHHGFHRALVSKQAMPGMNCAKRP